MRTSVAYALCMMSALASVAWTGRLAGFMGTSSHQLVCRLCFIQHALQLLQSEETRLITCRYALNFIISNTS